MYNVSYADAGSRSQFYTIDDKRGFKEFDSKDDAEDARKTQLALAEYNLAPKVLSEVGRIRLPKNLRYTNRKLSRWGFITERAELVSCGGNDCDCGECEDVYDNMLPKIERLTAKIDKIGYSFVDNHIGNIGYVRRRGRKVLVCIDTGSESVYDESFYDEEECSCYQCQQYREGR